MASISISGWSGAEGRTYTLTVVEQSYSATANTSVVKWTLSASGGSSWMDYYLYASVNGTVVYNQSGSWSKGSFPAATGSTSGTMTISHGSDGKKTIGFYIEGYAVQYSTKSASGSLALTNIDRTAPTITQSAITDITKEGFTIHATSNTNCNIWQYSLNNGSSWTQFSTSNTTSVSYAITGLTMNTSYNVYVRARKTYNNVYGTSGVQTAKTLGYSFITSVTDTVLGNAPTVTWTPLDDTFTFKVGYSIGSWSWTSAMISPASTSEQTFNSYTLAIADIAPQITDSKTGAMTCSLETFLADGTSIGTATKTFTVTVPATVLPSLDSITLAEGEQSGYGVFVKTLSTVEATVTASGIYGSTIGLITMQVEGALYNAVSGVAESVIFNTSGTLPVVITATDSRGYQVSETRNITVYDYYSPSATMDIDVYDTTITVTVTGEIAPVNNLNQKRLVITRVRLSDQATQTYTVNPLSSYSFTETWTQTLSDASTSTYEYTAVVYDTLNSVTMVERTGIVTLSLLGGGGGASLFGRATDAGFWIYDSTGAEIRHDISSAQYLELANLLAEAYSVTADYFVGEFCIYNSYVWECTTAITGGEAWNASHWTQLGGAS